MNEVKRERWGRYDARHIMLAYTTNTRAYTQRQYFMATKWLKLLEHYYSGLIETLKLNRDYSQKPVCGTTQAIQTSTLYYPTCIQAADCKVCLRHSAIS